MGIRKSGTSEWLSTATDDFDFAHLAEFASKAGLRRHLSRRPIAAGAADALLERNKACGAFENRCAARVVEVVYKRSCREVRHSSETEVRFYWKKESENLLKN